MATDAPEESIFEKTSQERLSRSEKYYIVLDAWLLAPSKILLKDPRGLIGVAILLLYLVMGTIGPYVIPAGHEHTGGRLVQWFVTAEHPLGTDRIGRDLLGAIVHSTPMMLKMMFSGAVFTTVVATVVGTVSGYVGGFTDRVLQVIMDVALTIPGLVLVMVLALAIEPENPYVLGVILTINAWGGLARSVRSEVLSIREESYIEAQRALGVSKFRIILIDVTPNIMPYILINFMTAARSVIFSSVALYFLGVLPWSGTNWGIILQQAYDSGALSTPHMAHWLWVPILAISGISIGLVLISQALDRVFNPRIRAKHQKTVIDDDGIGNS